MDNYTKQQGTARKKRECPSCTLYPYSLLSRKELFTALPSPLITWRDYGQEPDAYHVGNEIVKDQRYVQRVLEKKRQIEWQRNGGKENCNVDEQ